jgi:hypothetical protein
VLDYPVQVQLPTKHTEDQFMTKRAIGWFELMRVGGEQYRREVSGFNLAENFKGDPTRW